MMTINEIKEYIIQAMKEPKLEYSCKNCIDYKGACITSILQDDDDVCCCYKEK